MSKISRGKDGGRRQASRSTKIQVTVKDIIEKCWVIGSAIKNLKQQYESLLGEVSKIYRSHQKISRLQQRRRVLSNYTRFKKQHYPQSRKKKILTKKEAAAKISGHHINLEHCRHLRHQHSGGIPVVVLDRNQSDALGRLFFQMSPKQKELRQVSIIQEQDASANEFSGPPEYQGKDPMGESVPSPYEENFNILPHSNLNSLPHINLKRCSHLHHWHSGGIPVVVLDRNQSNALGRRFFLDTKSAD